MKCECGTYESAKWHERGELPPVGEVVECNDADGWQKCKILAVDSLGQLVVELLGDKKVECNHPNEVWTFRPIPTERDKLVDECVKILGDGALSGKVKSLRDQAELLVARGWRPIKQQDEIEFGYKAAKSCKSITVDDAMGLYRAGCRFIERGE